ncbi:hypothetical protein FS837_006779 [Tulasnella sp. UAMH 9824]|nr:hypothetical protein FS837_006779 [Tulasnella sp. UAMH 9824]
MGENIDENEEVRQATTAPVGVVDELQEAMKRLKISPRKVLESLSHLRIDRARIQPIESQAPRTGGKADVEAAILTSARPSNPSEPEITEYVAVKKLRFDTETDDDRTLAPFAHEVNLLNDLSHPNVVSIVGFVEDADNGVAWMVFSWEKNGNLREFIRSANWELPERVFLIHGVARGLSYLHGMSPPICHGDLKSLNILVNPENHAVITDFGSARSIDSATETIVDTVDAAKVTKTKHHITTEGPKEEPLKAELAASGDFITMTGPAWTIRWAAPELLDGVSPDLGSDVWAFGWICWEVVTGNFPFDDEKNEFNVIRRIMTRDLPTISNNAQLNEIKILCSLMEECLRLDPDKRPPAMRCHQVLSFMDQVRPSSIEENSSTAPRSGGLLYALGWIEFRNGRLPKALEYFQQALEVSKSVGDEVCRAGALHAIGNVYDMQAQPSRAEESYIQSLDLYSKVGDQLGVAETGNALGDVYRLRGERSKAEESYIQSRDLFSALGNQLGFAQSVWSLGEVYRMRNEYSKAEEFYTQARDVYSEIGYQFGLASSVTSLGDVYSMRNEYSKAAVLYSQARDLYSEIGDQRGVAKTVQALGRMYLVRNEYSKAEEFYIQSRDMYSKVGDQLGFAQSVHYLGEVYRVRNEYSKAEESFTQSRDLYSKMGNKLGLAQSIQALGALYRMRNEYSQAEESYIQSRDLFSQIGSQLYFAKSLEGLGLVHSDRHEYVKAAESYLEAQEVYDRIGDQHSLANILWFRGWLHRDQAQYAEAERLVREASTVYGELGITGSVTRCDKFLAEIRQYMESPLKPAA